MSANSLEHSGFSLVAPVPYAFFSLSKTETLAFRDDLHLQDTTISDIYLVWSNNKSATSTEGSTAADSKDPPLSFHAVEIVHNLCVNTYQVTFIEQNSSTHIVSSSYTPKYPRDRAYNLTEDCTMDPTGAILCSQQPDVAPSTNITLLDPEDESKEYVAATLTLMRLHLAEMLQGFIFYGGDREVYDYYSLGDWSRGVALWGDVLEYVDGSVIYDPQEQIRNLVTYYDGIATTMSNLYVICRLRGATLSFLELTIAAAFAPSPGRRPRALPGTRSLLSGFDGAGSSSWPANCCSRAFFSC